MKKIDYTLEKVADKIYHVIIPDQYDMCMTFCRVQEFYESPFKEIRGKRFPLLKLMEIYSKKKGGGCFTYPVEWGGFNVPSHIIEDLYNKELPDSNLYDETIIEIDSKIKTQHNDLKYYLIGTTGGDLDALKHEKVHGFYYTNPKYKKEVISILSEISQKSYNDIKGCLLNIGYTTSVIDDEINAYLTADNGTLFDKVKMTKKLEGTAKKLQLLFEQYEQQDDIKGTV